MTNYIFSGIGHAVGKYKVTNDDIYRATQQGFLSGFDESKVLSSKNYQAFSKSHGGVTPFDYFAKYKMGFENRQTVIPFPPKKKGTVRTETSTEMAVRAIEDAFKDSKIDAEDISAWFVSTVSPHEQAPGIAATIKTYFVNKDNLTPTFTLTSGCSGFNLNLERAQEYLKVNPKAKHVVVAHTETMSSFLTEKSKFVSFVTFGGGAGAVVLSKEESETKTGLIEIENFQDLKMIDFVGVDKSWNLYMGESIIKDRAIVNLVNSSKSILKKSSWKVGDIDLVVPHQTGNAILVDTAKQLNVPINKMYIEAQKQFGNVSGSTVLLSLSLLNKDNALHKGMKILSATAGVGGKYGSFTYIVPQKKEIIVKNPLPLKGRKVLVLGATGGLGLSIVKELDKKGAEILVQYRSEKKISELKKKFPTIKSYLSDLSDNTSIDSFINKIKSQQSEIDYLIVASGASGALSSALDVSDKDMKELTQLNFSSVVKIYQSLFPILKETVVFVGSAAEDAQFSGSSAYVSSKRSLHGFVASASWEAFSKGLRMVYYMPGIVHTGMTEQLNPKQIFMAMQQINQENILLGEDVAKRIVKSLYLININKVDDSFENILTVRRDGYQVTDGRW
jgi:3-oxoacyl-[acyl-carrier-protein] synthase-3